MAKIRYKRKRRKYLEEVDPKYQSIRDLKVSKKRRKRFKKQRDKYGFDERETWNLDYLMLELIYERLRMYKDVASEIINLDFHKIDYKGQTYTQNQVLNRLIVLSKQALTREEAPFTREIIGEKEFWELRSKVFPYFWW
ncbi:hypothetical protein KQI68_07070 [Peptoniphilus sp. MSJ-1]|uniref:Uncharacterized protein n=1 Tax=Peptoniphilus ovalis TaxID=2841503 RepID=A0ABS6FHG5_9FIRM|nr:hypothetical protein [Peptoniphilus ovalis]MBU5669599.1 hypothetical protein [Peptoniphilus ovalis]